MKWNEENITKAILNLKNELDIKDNRMPSSTEMRNNNHSGLSRIISKNGGMAVWAKKNGLYIRGSGESNRIWTDEKIESAIKKSMIVLAIKRMPTRSELDDIGMCDLSNAISKSDYKFSGWANKLKIKTKSSETNTGMIYERIAEENIKEHIKNVDIKQMSANHPFDILVNDSVKIDVKVGKIHNHFGTPSYTFRTGKKYGSCDLYLCYGLDEMNGVKEVFLIPSNKAITTTINICVGGKSKYLKYKDRWDFIERLYKSFETATII